MKTKYLFLIVFGFILNKINAVTCDDIEGSLAQLIGHNNQIVTLNNPSNKIVFFHINMDIYAFIYKISAYVHYDRCIYGTLFFYNIENNQVFYSSKLGKREDSIITEKILLDNSSESIKDIFDKYRLFINETNKVSVSIFNGSFRFFKMHLSVSHWFSFFFKIY